MAHIRSVIRQNVVTACTGLPTTGSNITVGRVYPEVVDGMPTIDVTTTADEREDVQTTSGAGQYGQSRTLEITLTIMATGASYLDTLDQISLEAETAIMADPTMSGLIDLIELQEMETELTGEVERPVAVMTLIFSARYQVNAQDPQPPP